MLKKDQVPASGRPICDLQYADRTNAAGERTILTAFRYFGVELWGRT